MLRALPRLSNCMLCMYMHPTRGFHPSITALAQEHEQTAAAPTTHFRATNVPHPLKAKPVDQFSEAELANKFGRLQNHIWTLEEIKEKTSNVYKHQPSTISDYFMRYLMTAMYHTFNFITGYKKVNPTVSSIEWRLIVLESVAGVPGKIYCIINGSSLFYICIAGDKGLWPLAFAISDRCVL